MSDPRDDRSDGSDDPNGRDAVGSAADPTSGATSARPSGKRSARPRNSDAEPFLDKKSKSEGKSVATAAQVPGRTRTEAAPKANIFTRLRKFFREVVAELRKVIWPNRKQMITYFSVVLVFVTFMVAFISGLDLAFIRGIQWLFG